MRLLAELFLAAVILAALAFFVGLLLAAQTVGVEVWHDSALPQSAFSVVAPRTAPDIAPSQSGVPQTEPFRGSSAALEGSTPAGGTPSTPLLAASPRAVRASESLSSPSPASMTGPTPSLRSAADTARSADESRGPGSTPGGDISGIASFYAYISGGAAAGPALRSALGSGWRGSVVQVCVDKRVCVMTVLNDWCQCFDKRLIDLDARDFARLAPLSQGLVNVEVEW